MMVNSHQSAGRFGDASASASANSNEPATVSPTGAAVAVSGVAAPSLVAPSAASAPVGSRGAGVTPLALDAVVLAIYDAAAQLEVLEGHCNHLEDTGRLDSKISSVLTSVVRVLGAGLTQLGDDLFTLNFEGSQVPLRDLIAAHRQGHGAGK